MPRFSKGCFSAIRWIFFAIYAGLWISLVFLNKSAGKFSTGPQLLSALSIALVCAGAYLLFRWVSRRRPSWVRHVQKHFIFYLLIATAVLFVLQFLYVRLISTPVGWDCGYVVESAGMESLDSRSFYFSSYTNNLFLMFGFRFLMGVFQAVGMDNTWLWLSVVNTLAVDAAIILVALTAKDIFGRRIAAAFWGVACLFLGFMPWLAVPYSDTLSMPFIAGALYLYVRAVRAHSLGAKLAWSAGIGVLTWVGYLIKPQALIILIALIIAHFLYALGSKKILLRGGVCAVAVVLAALGVHTGYQGFLERQNEIEIHEEQAVPMEHFFAMGLNERPISVFEGRQIAYYGAFRQEDLDATQKQGNTEGMKEWAAGVAQQRLQALGPMGYMRFLLNKARWVTSEGNFFWGGEGGFMQWNEMDTRAAQFLRPSGKYYRMYLYYAQGIWILVLLGCVLAPLLTRGGEQGHDIVILYCALLGVLFFTLIFEGRSRYLINYLPLFAVLAAYGYCALARKIGKVRMKRGLRGVN